jgi:NADH-quinone oxidoreductase subunit L
MFLGAGSVMHGMDDEVDMRRYGGLRSAMPITFATFAVGYLAIIGFPGLSGFWSKDKIIEAAFEENSVVGLLALLGAGITAFYMTRLMLMTFFGKRRWAPEVHPHESPGVMTVPLMVLAAASVVGGALLLGGWITDWLTPVGGEAEHHELPFGLTALTLTIAVTLTVAAGVAVAFLMYARRDVPATAPRGSVLTRAARADLYGDRLNEAALMRPGQWLTRVLVWFDARGVDGSVNGLAALMGGSSGRARRLQTGYVRSYALAMVAGAVLVVASLLAVTLT